ncbi:hypothetical protein GCM10022255_050030 [Dactylosporangium darangshiense]|uniref:Uncharacterized protein n=1 Tax=Dactylosporangium darangshiense TaxID=579108 RepID=A0ABP8DCS3_9ACTN
MGATPPFIEALRTCLTRPTAVLACTDIARYTDAEPLYTALLRLVATVPAGALTAEQVLALMERAIGLATVDRPRRDWTVWKADIVHPQLALPAAARTGGTQALGRRLTDVVQPGSAGRCPKQTVHS